MKEVYEGGKTKIVRVKVKSKNGNRIKVVPIKGWGVSTMKC